MVEQQLGDRLSGKIQDDKTHDNVSYYAQSFSDADYGTTHVAVLARNGDAVSVTTTINYRLVSDQLRPSASVKRKKSVGTKMACDLVPRDIYIASVSDHVC